MKLTVACMVSATILHCSILTLNMQSARYLWLSGIISDCTSFYVVAFSVSSVCATLIPLIFLKSYGVMFECRSADNKACGCLVLVGLFGGSGTVSMLMSFTNCSVTSLATCSWCYLSSLSIYIACFPDIQTLSTSLWLKRCVLNMMSSSSVIWCPSSSIDWCNLMPILDTFCASNSSFTEYSVEGNSIWCGFHGWQEVNSICGNAVRSFLVGNQVLRNIFVLWYSKPAVKYPLGLVIFISSVALYGFSWTCVWNWPNLLVLIRVWSSSGIYKA